MESQRSNQAGRYHLSDDADTKTPLWVWLFLALLLVAGMCDALFGCQSIP